MNTGIAEHNGEGLVQLSKPSSSNALFWFSFHLAWSVFMHNYKNNKLPISFSGIFTDIINSDNLQTRHNDYNFVNNPAVKSYLEKFPYKQIVSTWNNLNIDLKATAEGDEFKQMLKYTYLSSYSCDTQCVGPCYSCNH